MTNIQQTAVDIIYQGMSDKIVMQDVNKALICIHISHDDFIKLHRQAKEMEKEQTRDDIKNELKLIGNYFDVGKLDQREQGHHIRFTSILKDRFDFYNETNGGNK